MDFLDPKKQRAHMIRLIAGYVLIGVAVLIATLILLYQAYGFGFDKDGEIIQNGLVFVSSVPTSAQIYLNGERYRADTNSKLQLPAGQYATELRRSGYRSWQRLISVDGGSVKHYDYPRLIPNKLVTTSIKAYADSPGFASQSPDRQWLVVQQVGAPLGFDVYDLSDPKKVGAAVEPLALPEAVVTAPKSAAQGWRLVEWSTDNRHLLVQHIFTPEVAGAPAGSGMEYVVIDRQTPAESVNLTRTLQLDPAVQMSLRDKKFDKFFAYNPAAQTLGTTSTSEAGAITPLIDHVVTYKSYGADVVLYVTDRDPATGQPLAAGGVWSVLRDGSQTYKIREHAASPLYLVDIAKYSGDWFVAAGGASDGKISVFKNPQRVRKASQTAALAPIQILRVDAPNFIQFSSNTQFVMIENGTTFANYDAENDKRYTYTLKSPIDAPSSHATWMDGHRLMFVSRGTVQIVDYDNINPQVLVPASPDYLPFFDRDYTYLYTLAPRGGGKPGLALTATSLLAPADQ